MNLYSVTVLNPTPSSISLPLRRELVFLLISAFFISSLAIMNIFGVSRFLDLSFSLFGFSVPLLIPIGVLPYPITFLCTDLVSELYGFKRANFLVLAGFIANLWIFFLLWLSGLFPVEGTGLFDARLPDVHHQTYAFYQIRAYAMGTVLASMLSYLVAQHLDVYLYHAWKKLTKGKHLWLRNNGSTLISQLVDTLIVVFVSYWIVQGFPIAEGNTMAQLGSIILSCYLFKFIAALLDTIPMYLMVSFLKRFLRHDE